MQHTTDQLQQTPPRNFAEDRCFGGKRACTAIGKAHYSVFSNFTRRHVPPTELPGRLTKGAGTHSWDVSLLYILNFKDRHRKVSMLYSSKRARTSRRGCRRCRRCRPRRARRCWMPAVRRRREPRNNVPRAGHANKVTDVCWSGEMVLTKDKASLRLWRARGDFALLRLVSSRGAHVAVHSCGQFILTGTRGAGASSEKTKAGVCVQ